MAWFKFEKKPPLTREEIKRINELTGRITGGIVALAALAWCSYQFSQSRYVQDFFKDRAAVSGQREAGPRTPDIAGKNQQQSPIFRTDTRNVPPAAMPQIVERGNEPLRMSRPAQNGDGAIKLLESLYETVTPADVVQMQIHPTIDPSIVGAERAAHQLALRSRVWNLAEGSIRIPEGSRAVETRNGAISIFDPENNVTVLLNSQGRFGNYQGPWRPDSKTNSSRVLKQSKHT